MSIAVSAVVKSSMRLSLTLGVLCAVLVAAGLAVGLGWGGDFPLWGRWTFAGVSAICALFAIFHFYAEKKAYRIDIGADGRIRLTELGAASCEALMVRLMTGSILWSGLMIIGLRTEPGVRHVLRILPDSVTPQEFRALAVALRWIAAHGEAAGEQLRGNDSIR